MADGKPGTGGDGPRGLGAVAAGVRLLPFFATPMLISLLAALCALAITPPRVRAVTGPETAGFRHQDSTERVRGSA